MNAIVFLCKVVFMDANKYTCSIKQSINLQKYLQLDIHTFVHCILNGDNFSEFY